MTITTGLVDTFSIPQLLRLIAARRLDPSLFATHHFALADAMPAYETFADAATTNSLEVVLQGQGVITSRMGEERDAALV